MPLSPDRRLRLRIAGALGLVVGVNAAVLAIVAWSLFRVWTASGYSRSPSLGLPVLLGAVLLGGIGVVAAQARYGSRSAVAGLALDEVDDESPRNVADRVRRLAAGADVPAPSVAVAEREEPGCLTVGHWRSPTIVVTTGLLDRLDDDELDAALAHEVAHVANRDLPVATAVAATLSITDRLLERERLLRIVLKNTLVISLVTGVGILVFAVPILLLGLAYLVLSAVARTLLAVNAVALRLYARTREYAADRGAASLTGDPASLASALRTLETDHPDRDLRLTASAALGIVHRPLAIEDGDEEDDEESWVDRFLADEDVVSNHAAAPESEPEPGPLERALSRGYERTVARGVAAVKRALRWRPSTHPPTGERVERLRTIERER